MLDRSIKFENLKEMMKISAEKFGERSAFYKEGKGLEDSKKVTYKEFYHEINSLGTALVEMGLKDKRIAVIGENRLEWELAYLAIVCGTGVVVPFDKSLPENELRDVIERSEVEAIFYSEKYEATLEKIKAEGVGKLKHLISMDLEKHSNGNYSQKELIKSGKELLKDGNKEFINAKIDNEKMSIMLFTSGTTSKSKIVALSHKNICTNLMDIAEILDVNSNDTFLSFLPLHHVFECTVGFLFSLYVGAKTVFCDGIRHIPENLKEYKVSVMACVPAIYERLFKIIRKNLNEKGVLKEILKKEELLKNASMEEKRKAFDKIHKLFGGNIKLFISGAASLDAEIEQKFRNLGFNLVQGYGLTETSPVVAIGTKEKYKVGSIGKTVPSVEAKIINPNKEGTGELIVKGPSIMLEYYKNKKATNEALIDGWFYTGDLAKIDEDGFIFISGRKKSVIVLKNGKNIFPEEMEGLINKIEGVEESFIYGKQISEDKNDIKINALIVYDEETVKNAYKVENEEEIYKAISGKIKELNKLMPQYKAIRGIKITTKPLIKTTTNKIKRQANLDEIKKFTN